MKIRIVFIALIFLCFVQHTKSQGLNNLWLVGYGYPYNQPFGGTNLDFTNGFPDTSHVSRPMSFATTNANISDSNGNLLFYTNGVEIADRTNTIMQNGSGLNPSPYTTQFALDGLAIPQASLIIPKPSDSSIYYLFHNTLDDLPNGAADFLYLTTIDMNQNGGLGAVISKNQIIISDKLNQGKLTAVRHANGRDWWVTTHKQSTNKFYKILVTPNGIQSILDQDIGINLPIDNGQVAFSPDGSKYAYYYPLNEIQILDFDRCTGVFSNPVFIALGHNNVLDGGLSFSPNSKVLYVSAVYNLYQFDMNAMNIAASKITVAVWDSFYSPMPPLATLFIKSQLAPDGKIYIATGNSTFHYHVINQPDSLGLACDVVQHGLEISTYYLNTVPNHPNYHLGPITGSICDTVLTGIPPPLEYLTLNLYPNPNEGSFQISYTPVPEKLKIQVFNILGEEVHTQLLPPWSQFQKINALSLRSGIYFAKLSSSLSGTSIKFFVE